MFGGADREDWKEFLTDDAKQILASLLESTKKHKGAYIQSDDVKIAQLWSALIEMKKEIENMKAMVARVEGPFRAIVSVGEAAKKKAIEQLVSEIVRPTDMESQEATKKLVESLMKF